MTEGNNMDIIWTGKISGGGKGGIELHFQSQGVDIA